MGLLLMLRCFDLGLWRMRDREDLFFFFWRGRAILVSGLGILSDGQYSVENVEERFLN